MTAMTGTTGLTIGASPQGKRKARWRTWAELLRAPELPAVGAQSLACVALAGGDASSADYSLASGALVCAHVAGATLAHRQRLATALLATSFAAFAALGVMHGHAALGAFGGAAIVASVVARERVSRVGALAPVLSGLCRALPYVLAMLALRAEVSTDSGTAAVAMLAYAMGLAEVERSRTFSLFAMAMLLVAPFLLATLAGSSHDVSALGFVVVLGGLTALALLRAARGQNARAATTLVYGVAFVDAVVLARFGFVGVAIAVAAAPFAVKLALRYAIDPMRGV